MFGSHSQVDRVVDIPYPYDRHHRHHLLGPHQTVLPGHFGNQQPDVLVLDITMPGMNGLDICREVSRKQKKVASLILTIHDNEQLLYYRCGSTTS